MAAGYVSEVTQFIHELKQRNPELEQRQRESRAIWWDKPQDLEEQRRYTQARVRQQSYVYQNTPKG